MIVEEIMTKNVITIEKNSLIIDAAKIMTDNSISCLIVTLNSRPDGILTESDILRFFTENGYLGEETFVSDAMTDYLVTVSPHASIEGAVSLMEENNVKRLAVIENDRLVGILTHKNIIKAGYDIIRK